VARPRYLDEITVLVERATNCSPRDGDAAGENLARAIKSHVGISAAVRVAGAGTIERSLGKAKRIIDKRPKE